MKKKLLSTLLAVLLAVTMLTGMAIPAQERRTTFSTPVCWSWTAVLPLP